MGKVRHFLGILNYGCTLIGLLQIACGIGCIVGSVFLFKSNEPLFLKIVGILVVLLGAFGSFVQGSENLKKGYSHFKHKDAERLIYRTSYSDGSEDD